MENICDGCGNEYSGLCPNCETKSIIIELLKRRFIIEEKPMYKITKEGIEDFAITTDNLFEFYIGVLEEDGNDN